LHQFENQVKHLLKLKQKKYKSTDLNGIVMESMREFHIFQQSKK